MKVGTKSILFGVHAFWWHPLTVFAAWLILFGRPSWGDLLCIVTHDWGYWGASDMEGPEGGRHPVRSALVTERLCRRLHVRFTMDQRELIVFHSRHWARDRGAEPSKLCYADKLSTCLEPAWFFILRARLSGELAEYRRLNAEVGEVPAEALDSVWLEALRRTCLKVAAEQRGDAAPYLVPKHPPALLPPFAGTEQDIREFLEVSS
ncbi:MAG: hypothetical protein ACYC1U_06740 [Candidatus Aquicultorales bacterium]